MGGGTSQSRRSVALRTVGAAVVVGATVAVYSPTLDGGFVSDDAEELLGAVTDGPLSTTARHAGRNFRPVNQWLHARTLGWFGTEHLPQHLVSLGLHLLVSAMVGLAVAAVVGAFGVRSARRIAAVAAALFLVHPSHTEAVSWVSARSDLLMALGLTLALAAWFRADRPDRVDVLLAAAGTVLALGSKEPAVTFPVAVAALEGGRAGWSGVRRTWPLFVVLGGYVVVRATSLGTLKSEGWRAEFIGDDLARTAANAAITPLRAFVPGLDFGGLAVGSVLVGLALVAARRLGAPERRLLAAAALALVVSTSLVSHLGTSPHDAGGERLVYFPSVLAVLVVAVLLARAVPPERLPVATGVAVLVGLATLLPAQLRWSDAAGLSADLTRSAAALPRDQPAIFLNIPDSLRGALVQRNTTGHDLELEHGWLTPSPVWALSTYEVGDRANRVEVAFDRHGRRAIVRLRSPGARFLEDAGPGRRLQVAGYRSRRIDDTTLEIDLPDPADPPPGATGQATLWLADGDAWRRVSP